MPEKRLSLPETALLIVLMSEAREVSNPDLKLRYGLTLDGKERRSLNDIGYVDSWRTGRSFTHVLTEKGWAWCTDELSADGPPPRAGTAGGALYALLGNLPRFLARSDLTLADVFMRTAEPVPSDVEGRIRTAYDNLSDGPNGWVALADLRSALVDLPRSDVDDVLRRMNRRPDVTLAPESDQKELTARDREAAVMIGNQEKHLLSIGS